MIARAAPMCIPDGRETSEEIYEHEQAKRRKIHKMSDSLRKIHIIARPHEIMREWYSDLWGLRAHGREQRVYISEAARFYKWKVNIARNIPSSTDAPVYVGQEHFDKYGMDGFTTPPDDEAGGRNNE